MRRRRPRLVEELAKLADDASSFYDVPLEEALSKIKSGLVGESEPLRAFGVLLSDAAVKAEAARLGIAKVGDALTEAQKVRARASLIKGGLADATGDHERTKGSASNRLREITGRLSNAGTTLGQAILPVFDTILGAGVSMLGGLEGVLARNKQALSEWSAWGVGRMNALIAGGRDLYASFQVFMSSDSGALISGGIGAGLTALGGVLSWLKDTAATVFDVIGFTMRNWQGIAEVVGLQVQEKLTNMGEMFTWLMGAAGTTLDWLGQNWPSVLADVFNAGYQAVKNALTNIRNLVDATWKYISNPGAGFQFEFTPLLKGFESTLKSLPDIAAPHLTSLQDQIRAATDRIGAAEAARARNKVKDAVNAAQGGGGAKKAKEGAAGPAAKPEKERRVETLGLQEFAKKLQESVFNKDDDTKTLVKQGDTQNISLKEIKEGINRLNTTLARGGMVGTVGV